MKSKTMNAVLGKQFWVGFIIGIVTIPFLLFSFMKSVVTVPILNWAELELIEQGKPLSIEEGPVVVYLWGTWSEPCLQELKDLEAISSELTSKGIQLVVISDEQIDIIDNFIKKNQLKLKFAKSQQSFTSLGITSIPVTYVVDRNGKTIYSKVGLLRSPENRRWKAALDKIMD